MSNEAKIEELKLRLSSFMSRIDEMDPEETSVEDVDKLISMLEELEEECK
ncbi:SE1561 family protein [Pontibacillus yanchengensis]|nr:SE1561 family protein [Pontibacillus yanchengensis]